MRVVAVSDTHDRHEQVTVPDGDVLIHAGDFTDDGSRSSVAAFNDWLGTLPHDHKIVVAGNHEHVLDTAENGADAAVLLDNAHYLHDASVVIDGVTFWGSPWIRRPWPAFLRSTAFAHPDEQALRSKQTSVPEDTDVLVTHGPPRGIGDHHTFLFANAGSQALRDAIRRVSPQYHVFGHVHERYGRYHCDGTTFLNAAVSTVPLIGGPFNRIGNEPIVFRVE